MKKIYLSLLATLFVGLAFGQIVFLDENDNQVDISETIEVVGLLTDNPLSKKFYILNEGSADIDLYVTRTMLAQSDPVFQGTYCDDVTCYPANAANPFTNADHPISIPAGEKALFKPAIFAWETVGTVDIKYGFATNLFTVNSPVAEMNVHIISAPMDLSVGQNQKIDFSIYPNPAQNEINLSGDVLKNGGTLVFLDALGKEVKRNNIQSSQNKLSISTLNNGVYFIYLLDENGVKSETKRLIVR